MLKFNKIEINEKNIDGYIQYFLLKGDSLNALESLQYPNTVKDCIDKIKDIINEKGYNYVIPLEEFIMKNIIKEALEKDLSVIDILRHLKLKKTPEIAATRVGTGMIVAKLANNEYMYTTERV